jgi:excisionase family DNA binding protein
MRTDIEYAAGSRSASSGSDTASRSTASAASPGSYDPARASTGSETPPYVAASAAIDEVLDVEDAAKLLRVGRNKVYDLVARNQLPHQRLGKQIRFSGAAIMRWLDPRSSQGAKEGQ